MIPYFLTFGSLLFFSFFDLSKKSKKGISIIFIFISIFFIFFAGFRWNVGTDWDAYLNFFHVIQLTPLGQSGHEILYDFLLRLCKIISDDYTVMLLATSLIIVTLTFNTLRKYSYYPILSVLILYAYSINSSGFGYRQDIAIAVTFFSFRYIKQRKLFKFIITVLIATLFHQTAIIFIFSYWIYNIKWTPRYIGIVFVSTVIGYLLTTQLDKLATFYTESAQGKLDYYLDNVNETFGAGDASSVLLRGVINRFVLLIIPILVIADSKNPIKEELKKLYNIFIFGFLFFIIFGSVGVVFLRFTRYFDIFQILVIPLSIYLATPKHKFVLIILLIIYLTVKFSILILTDERIYVPYQSIFD